MQGIGASSKMTIRDQRAFLDELVSEGLLLPTSVDGVYGRGGVFEHIATSVDALITRATSSDGAEVVRFPPVLPRRDLEKTGYLNSFPHLAGSVFGFSGGEDEAAELGERALLHQDWSEFQSALEVSLVPAACYPVYSWVAGAGALPTEGRLIDVQTYCFRHEPSSNPDRMQAFRQREHVRLGAPDAVSAWQRDWIVRGTEILRSIGLRPETVPASDPFFGRAGRMLSANQVERGLKLELVQPIAGPQPTALVSLNYHQDHFGQSFGIRTASGEVAHSACFGFGLERVALALFAEHGLQTESWPVAVRECLALAS